MVAGHTKNDCDSSFGHVKRLSRNNDVLNPNDTMDLISCLLQQHACLVFLSLRSHGKQFLINFKVPSTFKIAHYHYFAVRKLSHGFVFAKRLHNSDEELGFCLLKRAGTDLEVLVQIFDRNHAVLTL